MHTLFINQLFLTIKIVDSKRLMFVKTTYTESVDQLILVYNVEVAVWDWNIYVLEPITNK